LGYLILLHPRAAEFLKKADPQLRSRIKSRLKELQDSPLEKGERLKPTDFWRLKIGDYRAIYEIQIKDRRVIVLFIGHRRKVYDDFLRLV